MKPRVVNTAGGWVIIGPFKDPGAVLDRALSNIPYHEHRLCSRINCIAVMPIHVDHMLEAVASIED